VTLKRRIYGQFLVALVPLVALIGYFAIARDDLPQRVNVALAAYDVSLESVNAFKDFLNGVSDAIDSGRLSGTAVEALKRAQAAERQLAQTYPEDAPVADRIEKVAGAVSANATVATLMPLRSEVQGIRQALVDSSGHKRQALTALVEEEQARARRKREIVWVSFVGAALLVAFIGFVLKRLVDGITRPLRESVRVANAIASGHLDQTIVVAGNDEMAQLLAAMRAMQDNLSAIVRAVRAGADSVARGSEALSTETLDLSKRSEEQAANLEEAAASMEELSTTVRVNSGNARQANELANGAAGAAADGAEAARRVVETMGGITSDSKRIFDIVSVIDGIALQTNILALNAAVEAARAGEQGRGFAVVASEVRSLSQRCAVAAKEIKELIATSSNAVESGGRQVDAAGQSIEVLAGDVQRVCGLMSEIAAATAEQERGIRQVTQAVTQMDHVVQQNAVAAQRSASASDRLRHDARGLAETVSQFHLPEGGEPPPTGTALRLR